MKNFWNQVLDMYRESVIIQGLMALAITAAIVYCAFVGRLDQLTKEFWMVAGAVYGFYFRAKNDNQIRQLAKASQPKYTWLTAEGEECTTEECCCDDDECRPNHLYPPSYRKPGKPGK